MVVGRVVSTSLRNWIEGLGTEEEIMNDCIRPHISKSLQKGKTD